MSETASGAAPPALKDMKEGLSSARKPDTTHVRTPFKVYTTRPCEYGTVKYIRSNFLRPVAPGGYTGTPTKEDFERFRSYVAAADRHISSTLDAMERHQATDPDRLDVDGMKRAAYAVDTDPDTTGKVGPSFLPHIAAACASLNMAITQAVACGLLPADPGQPWRDEKCASPYAEEARATWRGTPVAPAPWPNGKVLRAAGAGPVVVVGHNPALNRYACSWITTGGQSRTDVFDESALTDDAQSGSYDLARHTDDALAPQHRERQAIQKVTRGDS